MEVTRLEDFVNVKHFRVFLFNDKGHIMLVQKKNRWDIPFGQVGHNNDDINAAVQRAVFEETKTALDPIVPVTVINTKSRSGNEIPSVILAAHMDGEAQIKPDEKTHHRLMEERNFLMQPGYRNKRMQELLEEAKHILFCEEARIHREEETQQGKEKYNYQSRL